MNTLEIFAHGQPKGQPRARACIRGRHAGTYDPGTADDWKACIAEAIKPLVTGATLPLFTGAVCVDVTFFFPRPKSHFTSKGALKPNAPLWHTSKPDRDNLDKAVLDVLTTKQVLADDKDACDGKIRKLYALPGEATGARITISGLSNNP